MRELKLGQRVLRAATVDSTMRWARGTVERGEAEHGALFIADAQTEGRGRHGRAWLSLPGKGLYLTAVLPTGFARPALTLVASLAVAEAAEHAFGVRAEIKWPNDLLTGGRKWGGTLAELVGAEADSFVLLGVGVNVSHTEADLGTDLARTATSLSLAAGRALSGEALLDPLLRRLEARLVTFGRAGFALLAGAFAERAAFAPGDTLELSGAGERSRLSTFRGLDEEGRLLLEGFTHPLASADVMSVRRRIAT